MADVIIKTHYGELKLTPGNTYYIPGDSKITKLVYQGQSPMNPDLLIFMILSINSKGNEVSSLEFINTESSIIKRLFDKPVLESGMSLPPELAPWNRALIDMNNCQAYVTISRKTDGEDIKLFCSLSFTGRSRADDLVGRMKIKIADGEIVGVEIVD